MESMQYMKTGDGQRQIDRRKLFNVHWSCKGIGESTLHTHTHAHSCKHNLGDVGGWTLGRE